MVDKHRDMEETSVDDILEAERPGRLNTAVGDTPLPEDNEPPTADEPDHDEESDADLRGAMHDEEIM